MNYPRATAVLLGGGVLFLAALDVFDEFGPGNAATISWVTLGVEARSRLFGVLFLYSVGLLCRHLFVPVAVPEPPLWKKLLVSGLLVLPAFVMVGLMLAFGGRPGPDPRPGTYLLCGELVGAFAVGFILGRYVPQHLAIPECRPCPPPISSSPPSSS
jgi:hypothetical protein